MRSRDRSDTLKQPMLSVSLGAAELSGCTHSHMHKHTHTYAPNCDVVSRDFVSDWVYI